MKNYLKLGLRWSIAVFALMALCATAGEPGKSLGRTRSTVERMSRERLKAAHDDVQKIKSTRKELPGIPGLKDYKAILHAHAEDAEHTGGTRPEMLADAKRAGVEVILLTDHFRPPRDFIDGSWRGEREGVLFIPGSESHGFLIHPMKSVIEKMSLEKPAFIETIAEGEGLIFLSHIEERVDHPMDGLTGMEVYNRHADAKDDVASMMAIMQMVTDPKRVVELAELVELYPDEMLATQLDYPQEYLDKWDAESQKQRVVGVAANDCHHNQVFIVKMKDENTVLLGTIVDKDENMRAITAEQRPGIKEMMKGHKPGDILARVDFDPYYRSFFNVSTHIFAKEKTEPAIRAALKAGHAYVSHDWMCDPKGFEFFASSGKAGEIGGIMGDEVVTREALALVASFPVECKIRWIKDGKALGKSLEETTPAIRSDLEVTEPGVYRVEGWLTVDGEDRPWIYSNPIYVRPRAESE